MKTKVLIILFLIVSLLGAFTLKAQPDYQKAYDGFIGNVADTILIADETTLTYTKTGAKIVSFSEDIFQKISLKWGEEFKSITIRYKTDRHGRYKEYVIYTSQELANNIRQWAKKNL